MSTEQGGLYRLRPELGQEPADEREPEQRPAEILQPEKRIWAVMFLVGAFTLLLVAQLIRFQVFTPARTPATAVPSTTEVDPTLMRGTIVDRQGHPLAIERFEYFLAVCPRLIKTDEARANVARLVAPLVRKNTGEIEGLLREHEDAPYLRLGLVTPAAGEEIIAKDWMTVTVEALPRRFYPEGNLAPHVVGFVAGNRVGYYGVEGHYDTFLRATSETPRLDNLTGANAASVQTASTGLPKSPFVPSFVGRDLVLTLDRNVQFAAQAALRRAINETRAESGTVIILEPNGSAIVAMVSWPDYDPNRHASVPSTDVYIDPAISKIYEPGSVFKLVTMAGAIDEGAIKPDTKFNDTDVFVYGEREIKNWDRKGRGKVTAAFALAESLNVTTAQIAVRLGRNDFYNTVQRFGFGQKTGVELAQESAGIVKFPNRGNWYPSDLAINAFGQGLSVTPLQMANAVAAIASGGIVYRPHIVEQIVVGNKVERIQPFASSRAIKPETAATVTAMMVDTVKRKPDVAIPGYAIAGKSGTAEIPLPSGYKDRYTIASYAGFFPADAPRFVVLVKLVRPKTSTWASETASPLFKEVIQSLIRLYDIPPDAVRLQTQQGAAPP